MTKIMTLYDRNHDIPGREIGMARVEGHIIAYLIPFRQRYLPQSHDNYVFLEIALCFLLL